MDSRLHSAIKLVLENLETLQIALLRVVEEGMIDLDDTQYNEILSLIDDVHMTKGWDELMEAALHAQTLEIDIAAWLSRRGRTTVSLSWPKSPK